MTLVLFDALYNKNLACTIGLINDTIHYVYSFNVLIIGLDYFKC